MDVAAVGDGAAQVFGNQLDGLFGTGVGQRGSAGGDVRFNRVGERVHTGGSGQGRGHTHHQDGVVDGDARGDAPVDDGHFHFAGAVGDDAETGDFGGRTRGGVHGEVGGHGFGGLVHAFVIVDLAAVGNDEADALTAVMGRTAADGDEAVAFFFLVQFDAGGDIEVGGVRNRLIIDGVFHRRFVEDIRNLFQDAGVDDTFVRDKQRLRGIQINDTLGDSFCGAYTNKRNVGNKEAVNFFNNSHCGILHCL